MSTVLGKIYCISNDINDKLYIGKTTHATLEERLKEHFKDSQKELKEKRPLYSAIKKYGKEHFFISLVEECDIEILSKREEYWINYYNSYYNGYNATLGGEGQVLYDYSLFIEDYKNGLILKEIAEKHGCCCDTVAKVIKQAFGQTDKNRIDRLKRKVYQFDTEGNLLNEFESQRAAARYLIQQGHKGQEVSIATNIGRVINGKRKIAEGYVWKATLDD